MRVWRVFILLDKKNLIGERHMKRIISALMVCFMLAACILPLTVNAEDARSFTFCAGYFSLFLLF